MPVQWKGVYPAVTTKFNQDSTIDFDGFTKNIAAQLDAGVNGIILGGSLGEASTLRNAEKTDLIEATKKTIGNKVPVIMNIAEQSTEGAVSLAQSSEKQGVDGLMMLPPQRYYASDEETVSYFKEVARSTSLPIMIYNNPIDYKIMVSLDMFEELIAFDNIQAVKESTRDVSNVTRIINRFGDRLKVLCGVDTLAAESMIMGASGWVAGLVCAFPKETVAIYRLVKAGRIEEAIKLHRWFFPLLELDVNPRLVQNIKLAEQMVGLGTEHVRAPRLPLSGKTRKEVINIIESSLKTRPILPDYLSLND